MSGNNGVLMVTISGIRGIVGDAFTPAVVNKYVSAFGSLQEKKSGKIVVGRDSRVSGPWVLQIVHGSLVAQGFNVVDVGIVPTPTVQFLVKSEGYDGGIIITSSHNDVMWNGLKFVESGGGLFVSAEKCERMFAIADKGEFKYSPYDQLGSLSFSQDAIDQHINAVLSLDYINPQKVAEKKLTVVLDSVNGAGGPIMKKLLERLGCKVIGLNLEPTGLFSHPPEPIPEHLSQLCEQVKEHKADLGIAVDPDVDRCVLIDETGKPLGEEYTLALAVKYFLGHRGIKTTIVKNLSTTKAVDDIAQEYGCETVAASVGEINVATKMVEIGSLLGGEGNGGVMLTDLHVGRDAIVAATLTLQHLSLFNGTISQLKATLPQYEIVKLKAPIKGIDPNSVVQHFKQEWSGKAKLNEEDGLHISKDDWWVHLRKSNTEPIIRVIGEAKGGKEESEALCKKFMNEILSMSKGK